MNSKAFLLLVAGAALAAFGLAPLLLPKSESGGAEERGPLGPDSFEQDGFRVQMSVASLRGAPPPFQNGDDLELSFRVGESSANGRPLSGLTPLSWLVRREEGEGLPDREQCKRDIRGLLAGRLARASAVNLNEYLAITLDDNNSLSIIDPQLDSERTKTVGMVPLVGKGADFALAADRRTVLVTLPETGHLAAADIDRRIARYLELGGRPAELALAPDGRYALVGQEHESWIDVVRVETFERAAHLELGPGPHEFAFRADSSTAYAASADGSVHALDLQRLALAGALEPRVERVGLALSEAAGTLYVGQRDGTVASVDLDTFTQRATLALGPGLTFLAMAPDGRHGFALFAERDELRTFDTATGRLSEPVSTAAAPQRVEFSADFAYVMHAASEQVLLADLGVLAQEERLTLTPVPMGQRAPLADLGATLAPLLARLPEGGGAMLLNPADRALYHFMEGMNAPAGSYRTYPWTARGVLIVDRTLHEVEDGRYRAAFRAPAPGHYTVPFLLPASPQLYGCFELEIGGVDPAPELWKSLRVESLSTEAVAGATAQELRVRLVDATSGAPVEGLQDLAVLVMRGPRWEWRGVARPLADGVYAWSLSFPEAGRYKLLLASQTRGVEFGDLPSAAIEVSPPPVEESNS